MTPWYGCIRRYRYHAVPRNTHAAALVYQKQLVGVFGIFGSLTIKLSPLWNVSRVLAQDLLADAAQDITSRVHLNNSIVKIDGAVVAEEEGDAAYL